MYMVSEIIQFLIPICWNLQSPLVTLQRPYIIETMHSYTCNAYLGCIFPC